MNINPLLMQGKTILVTGASSGIGRETAILLSQLGARVVLAGRDIGRLEETRSRLQGADHLAEPFDLTALDSIPGWCKQIALKTGPLAGLVHSAGVHQAIPLRMVTAEKTEQLLRTNLVSAVMLLKGFRQKGCSVKGGSVVLLASVAGLAGAGAITVYSASKAALTGLTRSAAIELAPEGLRVNCVAPGYVQTEMAEELRSKMTPEQFGEIEAKHPLGLGTPLDVAQAIAFLLGDTGRWITGSTLVVDGGYTAA